MRSIILSVDKYHRMLEHSILTYQTKWTDNKLLFRIPWNEEIPKYIVDRFGDSIELVQTPKPFKQTINSLLEGLDDDEWIFWAMDDTYIETIDPDVANKTIEFVNTIDDTNIVGVSFSNLNVHGKTIKGTTLEGKGLRFVKLDQYCQWMPQCLRVKVLRALFESVDEPTSIAKELDHSLHSNNKVWKHFKQFHFFMLDHKTASWGECVWRGKITENCAKSFKQYNLSIPDVFLPTSIHRIQR